MGNKSPSGNEIAAEEAESQPAPAPPSSKYTPSLADVLIICSNISTSKNALPSDVLIMALKDFAGYWPEMRKACTVEGRFPNNADAVYLELPLRAIEGITPVHIEVEVISKDQGWSSYPSEAGKRTSNSWGELALSTDMTKRHSVYRNIHAGKVYETHLAVFNGDSAMVSELQEALLAAEPGQAVNLRLMARSAYPAWVNYIASASITVLYRVEDSIMEQVDRIKPSAAR